MVNLTWRVLGRASVFILALVLALGTTVPALANDDDGLERQGFSGVVTVLEERTITVETEDGESLTATITEDTKIRLPSKEVQSVLEVELKEEARVAILAQVEADDSLTALWILVKPEHPLVGHLLGTVITMEGNRITIVDAQGNEHTVDMPEQALQGLQVGDVATFVGGRPGADGGDDGDANGEGDENLEAHDAVTARDIQARVLMHASSLRQRAEAGDVPVDDAEERIQFLSELMDIIQIHVEGVLTAVLEQVPEPAKDAIERAMEQAKIGFEQAKAAIQRQGPPAGVGASDNASDNGKPAGVGPSGEPEDEEPEE